MTAIEGSFEFVQELIHSRGAGPLLQFRHLHGYPGPARETDEQFADQRRAAALFVQL